MFRDVQFSLSIHQREQQLRFTNTSRTHHGHDTGSREKFHKLMNPVLEGLQTGGKKTAYIAETLKISTEVIS